MDATMDNLHVYFFNKEELVACQFTLQPQAAFISYAHVQLEGYHG